MSLFKEITCFLIVIVGIMSSLILVSNVHVKTMSFNMLGNVCVLNYVMRFDNGKIWNVLCLIGNVCVYILLGNVCVHYFFVMFVFIFFIVRIMQVKKNVFWYGIT